MEGLGPQPTIDDLIRAAGEGRTPYTAEVGAQYLVPAAFTAIALGVVAYWKVYRVKQAREWAVERSEQYYPHLDSEDTKKDAYRHILANMMVRRYVGAPATKYIADRYENENPNLPRARVMDLHNNDIGRVHRYSSFRGHWLWDRWDHSEWAVRVRNYIDATLVNGEYIPEWVTSPPSLADAWAREACVPREKFIYFVP